jgi:capsular polysaccharide biosynthesis protein
MSEQALDLKGVLHIVRRHKILVGGFAVLGLLAGAGYAVLRPPMVTSNAIVALPSSNHDTATQVVVAGSNPVLRGAVGNVHPAMSLQTLRTLVQVKSLTSNLLSISAQGKTAAQAEGIANAVANSYVAFVKTSNSAAGTVHAHLLEPATNASGTSRSHQMLVTGGLGFLAGMLIGVIVALAMSRTDRRLLQRDQIANAIGVPVLASIPVAHPTDASRWTRLLEDYAPNVVHAWQLRTALRYLGQADAMSATGSNGDGLSVAILSLSSDRGALALGPQLAVFAASVGIPTALVIGPGDQAGTNATAALRTACAAPQSPKRSSLLRVAISDHYDMPWRQPGAKLTVVVTVLDGRAPRIAETIRTSATVLGVSAGAVTAAQLAGVAVDAAADNRQIDGILVADPDPADQTTGRVPQLRRPTQRRMPARRRTDMTTETRR